ncbi:MAG TPA: hypothetical protein PKE39_08455 [Ignavibacteria bacterium]|nr:hypothetical protein [Ignavibacteria bacterium]HMQ99040.1 hypothetical protein [Ignavibacteria bacterium]
MKKSILIEILSGFSHKEVREFSEYVGSPFFNKNQSIIKLNNYLRIQHPVFDKNEIEKRKVFQELFPKVKYNDGFMRTLIFGLSALAENFLSYTRYKNSYYKDKTFLLYELNDRHLDRHLEKNIKLISRKLESEKVRDSEYYLDKYNLENEKYLYYFRKKPDVFEKIVKKTKLSEMTDYLSTFYYSCIAGDYTRLCNLKNIYNFEFDTRRLDKFLNLLSEETLNKTPCVLISYYELMLFKNRGDVSYFYKIKEQLEVNENTLEDDHVYNIYINLINFCNRKIAEGHKELETEVFELYRKGLEKKIFPFRGILHFRFYTTVTETALKLGEYDWSLYFINSYKNRLPAEIRENSYNYARALYDFETGNFTESLETLSLVKYNDVYHKLKCKCLTAMLFYELGYTVQLLSHIDAFNHFIMNDKLLNKDRKKLYSAFIKYLKKIDSVRLFFNSGNFESLWAKIETDNSVYNKKWLLKKMEEMAQ